MVLPHCDNSRLLEVRHFFRILYDPIAKLRNHAIEAASG